MQKILTQPYNRQSFIEKVLLPTFQGRVDDLKIYDSSGAQSFALTASEQKYAKWVIKYGEFITRDETGRSEGMPLAKVSLYEVILQDTEQVERSRVGIAALVKKHIMGNDAVLVNFAYENPENRPWRFSFMAHDAVFAAGEMQQIATNPKRYTYVFGEPEETYRTALDRFSTLSREKDISVASLKNAFGVEALSKAFFDEYRDTHYTRFVDYLKNSPFKQSFFNGDEKAIRDFVKKLLGRIVFLYFIQKKGWLGASTADYQNGDKNFMSRFYEKAGADETFYASWLSKLFFDTLNNKRPDDAFEMPDGSVVRIPYLNGGLFVREDALGKKESDGYHLLTFPPELFGELFAFFDSYNFTIYEDSPEEHTVAVDPEMLGHIFENLLEDNKDKGAFYTPKEIVHYMTQASLIEYLHTQIPEINREQLEAFVKNKAPECGENELSQTHKKQIDQKLDEVKICDPAIGSGAFPMGLLQEIFTLKERIYFHFAENHSSSSNHKYHSSDNWSPARVKEHIIQNSIYGVDIEQGAVDIARLRFWLSLIVDEENPKPLPNLDYKIVQGNSLVSKFGFSSGTHKDETIEIDWSTDDASGGLFGQEFIIERTRLLKAISEKQKAFFTANTAEKPGLAKEIRQLKLDILSRQLELMIEKGAKEDKNAVKKPSKKLTEKLLQAEGWKRTLSKINRLKLNGKPFKHFDWKLDFPEVLNPLAVANTGFDIVIGNPPYIKEYTNRDAFEGFRTSPYYQGKMDLWYGFACVGLDLLKKNGIEAFIAQNNWITSAGASKFRDKVLTESEILVFTDFWNYKVFETAGIQTMVYFLKKTNEPQDSYTTKYSKLLVNNIDKSFLDHFLKTETATGQDSFEKIDFEFVPQNYENGYITFANNSTGKILSAIINNDYDTLNNSDIAQGIVFPQDFLNKKSANKLNNLFGIGTGVFALSDKELQDLNLTDFEKNLIKPYFSTSNFNRYYGSDEVKHFLIYTDSSFKRAENIKPYPNIKKHLDQFGEIITSDNKPYGLHRARDERFFVGEKIIVQRKCPGKPIFTYADFDTYVSATFYLIKTERFNLKYLTALFNSKLIAFWLRYKGKMQGNNYQIDKAPLMNIPIVKTEHEGIFAILVDYILLLYQPQTAEFINYIGNEVIIHSIEEIIDALVFELYFPEEFKTKGIAIEKYAGELFVPIEGLREAEKMEKIKAIYEELRKEENPLRQQIKRMKTELKYLLQPILSL